jgi:hypothetical protein
MSLVSCASFSSASNVSRFLAFGFIAVSAFDIKLAPVNRHVLERRVPDLGHRRLSDPPAARFLELRAAKPLATFPTLPLGA